MRLTDCVPLLAAMLFSSVPETVNVYALLGVLPALEVVPLPPELQPTVTTVAAVNIPSRSQLNNCFRRDRALPSEAAISASAGTGSHGA